MSTRHDFFTLIHKGQRKELFAAIFPPHVAYLRVPFAALDDAELAHFEALAEKLRAAFASAIHDEP